MGEMMNKLRARLCSVRYNHTETERMFKCGDVTTDHYLEHMVKYENQCGECDIRYACDNKVVEV